MIVISLLQGPNFCVSHQDFLRLVLPSLCDGDAVLLLHTHSGGKFGRRSHDAKVTLRNIPRALTSVHLPTPPTPADDLEEVAATASSVREKTSNLHAICHQVDGGDTAAAASLVMCLSVCLYICMSVYPVGLTLLCVFFFNRI